MRSEIVFIVDDDEGVRKSVSLLMHSINLEARAFATADEFLDAYEEPENACMLLDVRMPGMSGLDLQNVLIERNIEIPIIFITAHGDIPMAVHAIQKGAVDFLQKPFRDQDLIDLVQKALAADLERRESGADREELQRRIESLTPRELQVMESVVAGDPNKKIAYDLELSERTVEIHRSRVMKKMKAYSLAELVQLIMRARS
ncbi:MAG: response regulator transcription factor [Gemmatimonadetes bacterium]|nr:response regulator transcription factor [Gemmatimonadota bacterium]